MLLIKKSVGRHEKIRKKILIDCPLFHTGSDEIWNLSFTYYLTISEAQFRLSYVTEEELDPVRQEENLRMAVQHSFDTLSLYGFHQ